MKIFRDQQTSYIEGSTILRAGFTASGDLWMNLDNGTSILVEPKDQDGGVSIADVSAVAVESVESA